MDFAHFIEYSLMQNIKFIEHSLDIGSNNYNDFICAMFFERCVQLVTVKMLKEISNTCKSKSSFTFDDRIFYVAKWAKIDKMVKNGQKSTKTEIDHF